MTDDGQIMAVGCQRHRFDAGHNSPQEAVRDQHQNWNTRWEHVCRVCRRQPFSCPRPRSRQPTDADHRDTELDEHAEVGLPAITAITVRPA